MTIIFNSICSHHCRCLDYYRLISSWEHWKTEEFSKKFGISHFRTLEINYSPHFFVFFFFLKQNKRTTSFSCRIYCWSLWEGRSSRLFLFDCRHNGWRLVGSKNLWANWLTDVCCCVLGHNSHERPSRQHRVGWKNPLSVVTRGAPPAKISLATVTSPDPAGRRLNVCNEQVSNVFAFIVPSCQYVVRQRLPLHSSETTL